MCTSDAPVQGRCEGRAIVPGRGNIAAQALFRHGSVAAPSPESPCSTVVEHGSRTFGRQAQDGTLVSMGDGTESRRANDQQVVRRIERPDRRLLTYFILSSFVLGPLFPFLLVPRYLRFRTLRYDFGDDGISMRWGVLFRREINLTYARIQDIHLRSNVIERWLGLARVLVQTASGSSKAELTIEGVLSFEALRDFIYDRMRGVAAAGSAATGAETTIDAAAGAEPVPELQAVLDCVAAELREIRLHLERRASE